MITSNKLEQYKSQKISDVKIENLKDISSIYINQEQPVVERVLSFMAQIGNPYLFKVGDTPVKVSFTSDALTLQECMKTILTKNIR
jgi:hypothetical protein